MDNAPELAAVLGPYFDRSPFSISQLAKLSGVPEGTLVNWLQGRSAKPHRWQGIARVCSKLELPEAQATEVLQAAGHPSIAELLAHAVSDEDIESLSRWSESARMRQANAPFQAIADFPHFVGRVDNLEVLKKVLRAGKHVTPYVLEGMPGVGKTALAAHLAYELRPYFLDGVLWARLDTSDTMSILSAFANAYGSDVSKYPDVDSRSQVLREILASKRVMIILDNAQRSEQVLPLLPPTGACAVIITTRHRGLSVARGARRFRVEVFDREKAEALALFAKILGQERERTERACLLEIADLLGHLPLAVDIAASRLANEPNWSTWQFLDLIKVEKSRLGNLVYEDLSVRTSFNLSFGALEPEMRQMYASLGALCSSDFGTDAVAYITRSTREEAEAKLRVLYSLSLIQQARPGRYQLHPLLCTYAREQLADAAVPERMVEFFVQYAEAHKAELAKIGQEIDGILGALQAAQDLKMPRLQVRGTTAVFRFLEIGGLYDKADFILQQAQRVAVESGDTAGEAKVLLNLGRLATRRGDLARGQEYWRQALAAATAANDRESMSAALGNLGIAAYNLGQTDESAAFFQESLTIARANGWHHITTAALLGLGRLAIRKGQYDQADPHLREALHLGRVAGLPDTVITTLTALGASAFSRGRYDEAEDFSEEALGVAREIGDRDRIGVLLENLGSIAAEQGALSLARSRYLEALSLAREIGSRANLSSLLGNLGSTAGKQGDHGQAAEYFQESLALAREVGHGTQLAEILTGWGEYCLLQNALDSAQAALMEASDIARRADSKERLGRALFVLAKVTAAQGDVAAAGRQGRESQSILQAIGSHLAAEVSQWLIGLPAKDS